MFAIRFQSADSVAHPPSAILADSASYDGNMDSFLDWLDQDSDTSDEQYATEHFTPRDDSTEDVASSEEEQPLKLSTAEAHAAAESTGASEVPCTENQSILRDSTVAGTIPHIYFLWIANFRYVAYIP